MIIRIQDASNSEQKEFMNEDIHKMKANCFIKN